LTNYHFVIKNVISQLSCKAKQMAFIVLEQYPKNKIKDLLEGFKNENYELIFNIGVFKDPATIPEFFNPDKIQEILLPLYKGKPIVVDVSEFTTHSGLDVDGIKYVINNFGSSVYPNIQIIYYIKFGAFVKDAYSIRYLDTLIASHLIYRECMGKQNDLNIVMSDFATLGFQKATKLMSLCVSCKFYEDESYYLRCAVNPSLNHDIIFTCRDYDQDKNLVII
jgi:hypothetical protein